MDDMGMIPPYTPTGIGADAVGVGTAVAVGAGDAVGVGTAVAVGAGEVAVGAGEVAVGAGAVAVGMGVSPGRGP